MQKPESHILLVGQALKDYRKSQGITQEQLAEDLGIDPRTLRLWENERPPESIRELRRISDLLGIEPERLGLAASLYLPKTPEMVEEIIEHVWALMDEIRVHEVHAHPHGAHGRHVVLHVAELHQRGADERLGHEEPERPRRVPAHRVPRGVRAPTPHQCY